MSTTKKRKADNDAVAAAASTNDTRINNSDNTTGEEVEAVVMNNHTEIMDAAKAGNHDKVLSLLDGADDEKDDDVKQASSSISSINNEKSSINNTNTNILSPRQLLASYQDPTTGTSPLMIASQYGHLHICQTLLENGAPWNAIDRYGKCAGNYATDAQQWDVVNLLVEAGTKAEVSLWCVWFLLCIKCYLAALTYIRFSFHFFIHTLYNAYS